MELLRIGDDPVKKPVHYFNNQLVGHLTLEYDGDWYFEPKEGGLTGLLSGSLLEELGERLRVLNEDIHYNEW